MSEDMTDGMPEKKLSEDMAGIECQKECQIGCQTFARKNVRR